MKKRLLMTASTFSHIQSFHLPYIRQLAEEGWEVHLACGGEPCQVPFAAQCEGLSLKKSLFSPKNIQAALRLRRLIRRNAYDRIIMHTSLAAFWTKMALVGMAHRPKTLEVVHGYLFDEHTPAWKAFLLQSAARLTARKTDLLLTMNRFDDVWARSHRTAGKVRFIPGMGVDEERLFAKVAPFETGFPPGSFVLVFAGEFSERKNQAFLIRAMVKLPEHIKLILAGEGTEKTACEDLVGRLGLQDRIYFPGQVASVAGLFGAVDAVVSASRIEGLPFNIMEAMLCGKPLIVSRIKGHTDLVNAENGFLFDTEEDFIGYVKTLAENPTLAAAMGAAGKRAVQAYTLKNVQATVMEAYLSM